MKKHQHLITALFCLMLPVLLVNAATIEDSVTHQFPAESISKVKISNVNGSIQCVGSDTDTIELICNIKIKAGKQEYAEEALEKLEIEILEDGDLLKVNTKLPKVGNGGFLGWITSRFKGQSSNTSVSYVLTVPADTNLSLNTVNGSMKVNDIDGQLNASSVNGSVRAESIGSVGNLNTVNGSIHCSLANSDLNKPVKLNSVNGRITVQFPKDTAFSTKVSTVNGGISCDFELPENSIKKKRSLKADINGGGPLVSLSTVNGGVKINQG